MRRRTKARYCLVLTKPRAAMTPRSSMRNANGVAKTSYRLGRPKRSCRAASFPVLPGRRT